MRLGERLGPDDLTTQHPSDLLVLRIVARLPAEFLANGIDHSIRQEHASEGLRRGGCSRLPEFVAKDADSQSAQPGDQTWADADVAARHNREMERRRAIEKIIAEGAEWGYGMAQLGFAGVPKPVIAWSNDGRPRILYGKSEVPALAKSALKPAGYDPHIKARNIEEEIRRIERDLASDTSVFASLGSLGSIQSMQRKRAEEERLAELKARLRQLDPNSALAD